MSLRRFLYVRPDEMQTLFAAVTGDVQNATYNANWLCDGLPGKPLRSGTGDPSWQTSNPPMDVDLFACINSTVDPGNTIEITGDATATLTQPPYRDQYAVNPFTRLAAPVVDVEDLNVAIVGNSVIVTVGQFVAGLARELNFEQGGPRSPRNFNKPPDQQSGNVQTYDEKKTGRKISGTVKTDDAGAHDLMNWWYATRQGVRMSLIVPRSDENDVWAVYFEKEPEEVGKKGRLVTLAVSFFEIPQPVWQRIEVAT